MAVSLRSADFVGRLISDSVLAQTDRAIHFLDLAQKVPLYSTEDNFRLVKEAFSPYVISSGRAPADSKLAEPEVVPKDGLGRATLLSMPRPVSEGTSRKLQSRQATRNSAKSSVKNRLVKRPVVQSGKVLFNDSKQNESPFVKVGGWVEHDREARKQFSKQRREQQERERLLDSQHISRQKEISNAKKLREQIIKKNKRYAYGFQGQILQVNPRAVRAKLFARMQGRLFLQRQPAAKSYNVESVSKHEQQHANSIFTSVMRNSLLYMGSQGDSLTNEEYNNYYQRQISHIPIIDLEKGITLTQEKEFTNQSVAKLWHRPQRADRFIPFKPILEPVQDMSDHFDESRVKPQTEQGGRPQKRSSRPNTTQGGRRPQGARQGEPQASKLNLNSTKASFIQVHNQSLADSVTEASD